MKNRMMLTTEGIMNINDVTPGYCVYSYDDTRPTLIVGMDEMTINEFIEIHTQDGRHQMMTIDEFAVLCGYEHITSHPCEFNKNIAHFVKRPYPYTAGFLIFAGNLKDDFISVPSECIKVMTNPFYLYRLATGDVFNGYTYLVYEVDRTPLKWSTFFADHEFKFGSKYEIIPYAYQYGTVNERTQFIQGAADACRAILNNGKFINIQNNGMIIAHKSQFLIENLQRILWSLNIDTLIEYNDSIGYILCFDINRDNLMNFYYNEDYIRNMIAMYEQSKKESKFVSANDVTFEMAKLRKLSTPLTVKIPRLAKPMLYWDADYLPIASC